MSNVSAKKIFIQIESASEQQENLKNQRKTLKVLQGVATDKENLTGRPQIDKLSRLKALTDAVLTPTTPDLAKRKKIETRPAETQTTPAKNEPDSSTTAQNITVEDLTSESATVSEHYWERLADRRGVALGEALQENQRLHERIEGLEDELNTSRQMLEETRHLVEVLTEMLSEKEVETRSESDDGTSTTEQAEAEQELEAILEVNNDDVDDGEGEKVADEEEQQEKVERKDKNLQTDMANDEAE